MLQQLDGHVVLCGGGRTGRQVMEELIALGLDVGDEMIVLGQPDQLNRLRDLAQA